MPRRKNTISPDISPEECPSLAWNPHIGLYPGQKLLPCVIWVGKQVPLPKAISGLTFSHIQLEVQLTADSQRLISSNVQPSGLPVGSGSRGNISLPQMDQAAAAATAPPKASACQLRVDAEQIRWPVLPRTMFYSRVNSEIWRRTVPIVLCTHTLDFSTLSSRVGMMESIFRLRRLMRRGWDGEEVNIGEKGKSWKYRTRLE